MDPRDRPLSPHLQVYKPQLTSMLSILHRASGVLLAFGMMVLAGFVIALWYGEETFKCLSAMMHSGLGGFVYFGFVAAFMYHFFNGIRHLFWDVGKGFSLPIAYRSGAAVVILTLISVGIYMAVLLGII